MCFTGFHRSCGTVSEECSTGLRGGGVQMGNHCSLSWHVCALSHNRLRTQSLSCQRQGFLSCVLLSHTCCQNPLMGKLYGRDEPLSSPQSKTGCSRLACCMLPSTASLSELSLQPGQPRELRVKAASAPQSPTWVDTHFLSQDRGR